MPELFFTLIPIPRPWQLLSEATPDHGEIVEVAWGEGREDIAIWQAPQQPGDLGLWLDLDGRVLLPRDAVSAWRRTVAGWRWYKRGLAPAPLGVRILAGYPPGTEDPTRLLVHDSLVGSAEGWFEWLGDQPMPDTFTTWARRVGPIVPVLSPVAGV